jgi:type II secretion system protein G
MNLATRVRGKNGKRGFTLIEILIVVVILGILAAIVIPQFTSASQEASMSSAKSQLQSIRSQIELFRVKNTGENGKADCFLWNVDSFRL